MVKEGRADGAMVATSKEGEMWPWVGGRRWVPELGVDGAIKKVYLRETDIFLWVEAFGGIGIAQNSDGIVVEERVAL